VVSEGGLALDGALRFGGGGGPRSEGEVKGVILDRDGTLIDFVRDEETGAVVSAFHPDHVRLLPGVVEGLRALSDAGYILAIATNQPGVAKGQISMHSVEQTNTELVHVLASKGVKVAAVKVCFHHPRGAPGGDTTFIRPCNCRKPGTAMLFQLAFELRLSRAESWMVGDSGDDDIRAGHAAGMRTGLLTKGSPETLVAPDLYAPTLDLLAQQILEMVE